VNARSQRLEVLLEAERTASTHAECPDHRGQWYHKSTGHCSCGAGHRDWATGRDTRCGGEHYYTRRHGVWVCVRCGSAS